MTKRKKTDKTMVEEILLFTSIILLLSNYWLYGNLYNFELVGYSQQPIVPEY
jgi:hypothetical protein